MVPIDGEIRENVGLLGSPSFEIPRTVERDNRFNHLAGGDELHRRLSAKNRHNLVTIALFLLARTFSMFVITVIGFFAIDLYHSIGVPAVVLASLVILLFTIFYGVVIERASTGFRPLRPKYCSIYDIDFWRTERFFKLEAQVSPIFNGTPFKSVILRMLGVRVGKRLFDDGASMAEKNLVTLGDNVTLNAGSWVQCHSQEDNAFKSDRISIGSDCTVGIGAMILYSVRMGDRSVLAPDSFLMKGEEIPADARWGGNPATEIAGSTDDRRDVVVDADRILPVDTVGRTRPAPQRPVHRLLRVAAAVAPAALGTLIVLAVSGGVAVAVGVPPPSRSAALAPATPAVTPPATTPPPSTMPLPTPSVESTRKAAADSSRTRSRSAAPTPSRRSSSGGAAKSTAAPTPTPTPAAKRRASRTDPASATTTSRRTTTSRPTTSSTPTETRNDETADDASTSTRSTTRR
jgi:hypothetical protein